MIRFAEIYHELRFPQAVALLRQWRGLAPLLQDAADFYRCGYTVTARRQPDWRNTEITRRLTFRLTVN